MRKITKRKLFQTPDSKTNLSACEQETFRNKLDKLLLASAVNTDNFECELTLKVVLIAIYYEFLDETIEIKKLHICRLHTLFSAWL